MQLLHITITTAQFDRSIEFYRDIAGLGIIRENNGIPFRIAFLSDSQGAASVELVENKDAQKYTSAPSIGFHTDDAEGYRVELIAKGYNPTPVISPIPGIKFFYVEDPNGIKVQFV